MPIFNRPDGDLVTDAPPLRRIMPYLMRSRTECAIYHESVYDLTDTVPWLRDYNRAATRSANIFHLFIWATARAITQYPRLNRFISGGRIYQRRDVTVSFATKPRRDLHAGFSMVKVVVPVHESFAHFVASAATAIAAARSTRPRLVDRELAMVTRLPAIMLRSALALLRVADRHNLLPARVITDDPLYASFMVTHVGSIGLDDTFHHLNEAGTAGIFAALGRQRPSLFITDGHPTVREGVQVRWTIDERVVDGLYAATGLRAVRAIIEHPAEHIGPPAEAATVPPPTR